ncbi:MAG: inositol-3-phosphate synthase [Planctomycetota bacterium]|nr:inositol-3-phosphate synthase [Planctomycetota bacterium]
MTREEYLPNLDQKRLGVWIIGALGDVATTSMVGAAAIARGLRGTTGLVSELEEIRKLPLTPLSGFVFGGHDVRTGNPWETALRLENELRCFGMPLLEQIQDSLEEIAPRIRPGIIQGASGLMQSMLSHDVASRQESVEQAVERVRKDLRDFAEQEDLESIVVIHLTSTEPSRPWNPSFDSLSQLRQAISSNDQTIPASVLYAFAAFEESASFVNFTPSLGSSIPALQELAKEKAVCHAGKDGKTGETLVRTMLAPMFVARNLHVLSWSGFNVLGNRDGKILSDPSANDAKTSGKDAVLRSILGSHIDDSLTRIDYVPSLKDWKTAWDLIHFEGFLGTKMTLQFTWQGADSALAAPLILDLARLVQAGRDAGRVGMLSELACFFKDPMGWNENSFPVQVAKFEEFARELGTELAAKAGPQ